jgi:hypothetical protein
LSHQRFFLFLLPGAHGELLYNDFRLFGVYLVGRLNDGATLSPPTQKSQFSRCKGCCPDIFREKLSPAAASSDTVGESAPKFYLTGFWSRDGPAP